MEENLNEQDNLNEQGNPAIKESENSDATKRLVKKTTKEEEPGKTSYIWLGIFMGATIVAIAVLVTVIIYTSKYKIFLVEKKAEVSHDTQSLPNEEETPLHAVTDEMIHKMNTMLYYANNEFLYDYDGKAMEESIFKGMASSLNDPYTVYYTADEYKKVIEKTDGNFVGLGAMVAQDEETGWIYIQYIYEGSGAKEAGLEVGDAIVAASGKDTTQMKLDDVIQMLRGEEGTQFDLTYVRGDERIDTVITRRSVDLVTASGILLENDIGYLRIVAFDGVTVQQFKDELDQLNEAGMKGLIIDLRQNGGGRLDVVLQMMDYILPEGTTMSIRSRNGKDEIYTSNAEDHLQVPCVVLVNGRTASAAEVFTGALQDYEKATIMGTQTYGKGVVQSVLPFSDGSALKITTQDYYTAKGHNIHGVGITPDVVVELNEEGNIDNQLEAAYEKVLEQIGTQ